MCGLLSAFPCAVAASQARAPGVRRIGFINGDASLTEPFTARMRALGYIGAESFFRSANCLWTRHAEARHGACDEQSRIGGRWGFAVREIRRTNPAMRMVIATCPGVISNGFAKTLESSWWRSSPTPNGSSLAPGWDDLVGASVSDQLAEVFVDVYRRAGPRAAQSDLLTRVFGHRFEPGVGHRDHRLLHQGE